MTAKKTVYLRVVTPFTNSMVFPDPEGGDSLVVTRKGTEVAKGDAGDLVLRAAAQGVVLELFEDEEALAEAAPDTRLVSQPAVDNSPGSTPIVQE